MGGRKGRVDARVTTGPNRVTRAILLPNSPLETGCVTRACLRGIRRCGSIQGVFKCAKACGNGHISIRNAKVNLPSVVVCTGRLVARCGMRGLVQINSTKTVRGSVRIHSVIVTRKTAASSDIIDGAFGNRIGFTPVYDFRLVRGTCLITGREGLSIRINGILSSSHFCGRRLSGRGLTSCNILTIRVRTTNLCLLTTGCGQGTLTLLAVDSRVLAKRRAATRRHRAAFSSVVLITLRSVLWSWENML